jgi:hypothetical protein
MPPLENPQWERFAVLVAKGNPMSQAYLKAGYKSNPNTKGANAAHLKKKPEVAARILELQARSAQKVGQTLDRLLLDLDEAYEAAIKGNQPGSAVAAVRLKAEMLGLVIHQQEITTTVRRPLREPGDASKPMSLDEWRKKFAPKTEEGAA